MRLKAEIVHVQVIKNCKIQREVNETPKHYTSLTEKEIWKHPTRTLESRLTLVKQDLKSKSKKLKHKKKDYQKKMNKQSII